MSKTIPSPKSLPIVGTLFSLIKEGGGPQLHRYVTKRHQELGPIYKEKIGPVEAYFVTDPNDMRTVFAAEGKYPVHVLPECWAKYNSLYGCNRGLYFMDGPEWMSTRKILNKHLLKNFNSQLQMDLTQNLLRTFEQRVIVDGKLNHFDSHVAQLSINFIAAYMLGTPFKSEYRNLSHNVTQLAEVVGKIFEYSVALSILPINLSVSLKLPAWTKFVASVDSALSIASELYEQMDHLKGDGLMAQLKKEGVSSDLIRRIVIDFVLAASDTTAISTQWTLYLLAQHPDIQGDLYNSLKHQTPCYENELLNQVIRESLRMYPLATFIGRHLPQDLEIRNYLIPRSSLVLLSVYTSSHNPAYFPSPHEFQPARWLRNANNKHLNVLEPSASIPYAAGARSCIGRKLAQVQMCATLAQLISKYHVEVRKPVDVVLKLITVPSEPIQFTVKLRLNN